MSRNHSGALALLTAGAMFDLYPAIRPWNDESTVVGATASMSSPAWIAAHFFAMLGFILLPLGLLALRDALADTPAAALARTAVVTTWIGAGLALPYYGAEAFGLHAIAGGRAGDLLDSVNAVRFQPLAMSVFGAGLVLLAVGAVLAAVAIWRANVLPRYSGIAFATAFVLFFPQFYLPPTGRIAHGVLTGIGLVLLAVNLWRAKVPAARA